MTIADFSLAVMCYAKLTNASATSWFRTLKRNAAVGGVAHSSHVAGLGCDVVYDTPVLELECVEWARRLGLKLIVEGDHHHLQPLDWQAG